MQVDDFLLQDIAKRAYQEAPWSFMGAETLPSIFLASSRKTIRATIISQSIVY
jgi:hypothetical protein